MGSRADDGDLMSTSGDPDDVLRSLRRYVAQTLGSPPWSVRVQRVRVADDERPAAVIEQSSGLTTAHSRAGTRQQGDMQKLQTFTVVCYPTVEETAAESRQEAGRVASLLDAGFSRGLVTDDDPPKMIGAPWRVPVYDFSAVPITGPDRGGPVEPYSYANVDPTFNVRPIQDPLDELRFTVVATVPLSWWQGGRVPPTAPTAAHLGGMWEPAPP